MNRNFGFSNIYLKVGIALIAVSLAMAAIAFVAPSAIRFAGVAGSCFISGAVLYFIGRVVQGRSPRPIG